MSVPPSEVQVLIDALQSMRATTYGIRMIDAPHSCNVTTHRRFHAVAACAFLFYDVALTMAREVNQDTAVQSMELMNLSRSRTSGGTEIFSGTPSFAQGGCRNQKWSFPKIAYISVRYYGIAYLV